MNRNTGMADRVIRILAAIGITALYLNGSIGGVVAIVLGIVAAALVATSVVGFCPGYVPLGISTRRHSSDIHA